MDSVTPLQPHGDFVEVNFKNKNVEFEIPLFPLADNSWNCSFVIPSSSKKGLIFAGKALFKISSSKSSLFNQMAKMFVWFLSFFPQPQRYIIHKKFVFSKQEVEMVRN